MSKSSVKKGNCASGDAERIPKTRHPEVKQSPLEEHTSSAEIIQHSMDKVKTDAPEIEKCFRGMAGNRPSGALFVEMETEVLPIVCNNKPATCAPFVL